MKDLTSKADDMNEADAVLIADVIGNVVLLGDSLNEVIKYNLYILDSESFNCILILIDTIVNTKR